MKKQKFLQAGQTLLEILLAFGVSVLVLSALILGVITSLNNTQYTKNQGLANSYAQEGMAVVRQLRDSSWSNFCSYGASNYCLPQNGTISPYDNDTVKCATNGIVGVIFARKVGLIHNSPDCCPDNTACPSGPTCLSGMRGSKATVTVYWADSKCPAGAGNSYCHKVELITCLSNINSIP